MMPRESQKTVAMIFPADGTVFAFFGADSPDLVHCLDYSFWCVMVDPCFINSDETPQKLFRIALKHVQKCFEVVMRFHFCSTVSKRGTHLADNFFMPNVSCRTFCMRSVEIFTMLAISLIFTRSANTTSWILLTISSIVTSIGRPGRSSSKMDFRPRLNSLYIL